jgi:hypothetical protein
MFMYCLGWDWDWDLGLLGEAYLVYLYSSVVNRGTLNTDTGHSTSTQFLASVLDEDESYPCNETSVRKKSYFHPI